MGLQFFRALVELIKPKIVIFVVISAAFGFLGGTRESHFGGFPWEDFFYLILTTSLTCAGVGACNQAMEYKQDALMQRTRMRPIPSGVISVFFAYIWGVGLLLLGIVIMYKKISPFMALGGVTTCFLYLFMYTPLKKITWWNTILGSFPGALPPLGGWYAATSSLSLGGWIPFLILFFWQPPHFYAIDWLYKKQYALAGYQMLSKSDPTGRSLFLQVKGFSFLLWVTSVLAFFLQDSPLGNIYLVGSFLSGYWFFKNSISFCNVGTPFAAQKFLIVTVIYLPIIFFVALADAIFTK